jgi:hypothetical protein
MATTSIMPAWSALLFTIFLIILLHTLISKQKYSDMSTHHHVNRHTIYNNLQHGDIIFSCVQNERGKISKGSFDFLLLPLNYGLTHMGVIKEEDGVKYIIDGHHLGKKNEYTLLEKPMTVFGGPTFRIYKTPLIHLLNSSYGQAYHVFRHPTYTLNVPNTVMIPDNRWLYFCSSAVYPVLEQNDLIHKESEKVLSYQPDSIMNQLADKGYQCFYMIHDRELDVTS